MKINEVVLTEGVWDDIKNTTSNVKGIVSKAGNNAKRFVPTASQLRTTTKKLGATAKQFGTSAANVASNAAGRVGDAAAKAHYTLTGKAGVGKNLATQQYFVKDFIGKMRSELAASRQSGVKPNTNAIIMSLASSQGWDIANSPYKAQVQTAIKNVDTTNFGGTAVKQLGALLYQVATANVATNTQAGAGTQAGFGVASAGGQYKNPLANTILQHSNDPKALQATVFQSLGVLRKTNPTKYSAIVSQLKKLPTT